MGISASVSITNLLKGFADRIPEAIMAGENKAAERLLALSVSEAPLELGTLIGSGQVETATDPEEGAAVVFDTPYAARLHEHPEYNFQNGRKGKYLEDPALVNKAELGAIVAKEMRDAAS